MKPEDEEDVEGFIEDWSYDAPTRRIAREMGAYFFGFLDHLEAQGASVRTLHGHQSSLWSIGKLECDYGGHKKFSPQIFLYGPHWECEFKRKFSDSDYAWESYARTWRALEKYVRESLGQRPAVKSASKKKTAPKEKPPFSEHQGQVLAYIHCFTLVNRQPPAQSDISKFFQITGPAVHQQICTLEKKGLLERLPGVARALRVLVPSAQLPELQPWTGARNG